VEVIATLRSGATIPEMTVCGKTLHWRASTTGTTAFAVLRGGRFDRAAQPLATAARTHNANNRRAVREKPVTIPVLR
jgi:hypothetical protein